MLKEFKEFMSRANVIDLAVAVVIGAVIRKSRHVAGRRNHHAAHRIAAS